MGLGFNSAPGGQLVVAFSHQVEQEQIRVLVDAHGDDDPASIGRKSPARIEGPRRRQKWLWGMFFALGLRFL